MKKIFTDYDYKSDLIDVITKSLEEKLNQNTRYTAVIVEIIEDK